MIINKTPLEKKVAMQYSPLTLAYMGDGVYEMYVRHNLVYKNNMPNGKLHLKAKEYVSSSGQSNAAKILLPLFDEEEMAIFKRGRNSSATPNKNNDIVEYHMATGLEALFGYLYLIGRTDRLDEFMNIIFNEEKQQSSN